MQDEPTAPEPATVLDGGGLRRLLAGDVRPDAPIVRFVLPDRDGPLRTLAGTGHRHLIGLGRDPRSGTYNPVEGVTEHALNRLFIADPDVVDHQTQPWRIDLIVNGSARSYLPDYWALHRDGRFEVGEVKIHPGQLRDPEYTAKLVAVRDDLALLGCDFRVRYAREIKGSPQRERNVWLIHYDRSASLDSVDFDALRDLEGAAQLLFGDVVEAIGGGYRARSAARRLITMGRIWIDLDVLLTDDSAALVRPASPLVSPGRLQ